MDEAPYDDDWIKMVLDGIWWYSMVSHSIIVTVWYSMILDNIKCYRMVFNGIWMVLDGIA